MEVTFLGVLLLIPLAYALLAAFEVQRAAYALTAATRDAGRAYVQADTEAQARQRGDAAAQLVVEGHGLRADQVVVSFECERSGCLVPGGTVTVVASTRVALPWLPTFVEGPASVGVRAEHAAVIDRFRADRS